MSPFVKSKEILNVLGLANVYKVRPSTFFDIEDDYTAYCFDEVCAYIVDRIEKGEEPQFKNIKQYKSFRELYAQYE